MRPTSVVLTPDGLFSVEYDGKLDQLIREKIDFTPQDILDSWSAPITVDEGTQLRHVFSLLRQLSSASIEALESLTNSNVAPYLVESTNISPVRDEIKDLYAIEVYKSIKIDNWETCDDQYELEERTSCHGIGEPYSGPGMEDIPVEERGNMYAIEFIPWNELRNLPITIRDKAFVTTIKWDRPDEESQIDDTLGEDFIGYGDNRKIGGSIHQQWKVTMTVGEFFTGLFDELCFFGSPGQRSTQLEVLNDRLKEVKDTMVNSDDNHSNNDNLKN